MLVKYHVHIIQIIPSHESSVINNSQQEVPSLPVNIHIIMAVLQTIISSSPKKKLGRMFCKIMDTTPPTLVNGTWMETKGQDGMHQMVENLGSIIQSTDIIRGIGNVMRNSVTEHLLWNSPLKNVSICTEKI